LATELFCSNTDTENLNLETDRMERRDPPPQVRSQVYQAILIRLEHEKKRRLLMARAGSSVTSGESSTDIPERRSDGENDTNSQKRKRGGEHERRPSQLGSVSFDALAKETSLEKIVNVIQTGHQEVCITLKYSCL
jgi:hypothetical protein